MAILQMQDYFLATGAGDTNEVHRLHENLRQLVLSNYESEDAQEFLLN